MSATIDPSSIRAALQRLQAAQPDVFGAEAHGFALNTPLAEADVAAIERQHGITLPADYRRFITEVGNGGAGPSYGVFPLGYLDDGSADVQPWGDFVGTLAEPFRFREAWNDLTGHPDAALRERDEDEYE